MTRELKNRIGETQLGVNKDVSSATYTIGEDDVGALLVIDNQNPVTLAVPDDLNLEAHSGFRVQLLQRNIGQVEVVPYPGVTIHSREGYKLEGQGSLGILVKINDNEWGFSGDLAGFEFSNQFYLIDPTNKPTDLLSLNRVSGNADIIFEDSFDSALGRGRYKIDGSSEWAVYKFLPVMSEAGAGGYMSFKGEVAGGTFSAGFYCFDAEQQQLGNAINCIADGVPVTDDWSFAQGYAVKEGVDIKNLHPGTKYVQLFFKFENVNDDVYIDGINMLPMNFASISLYS